jgi:PE family
MSFVIATPDLVQGAAQDVAGIGSSLAEATATAAAPTTGIAAAAQDEVSLAIASMFGNFGHEFQALSTQAQAFHAQFVSAMNAGAAAYVSTEAANATQQSLAGVGGLGNVGQSLSGAVSALQNGSAPALVSGQVQAGVQAILGSTAAAPTGAPTLIQGINSFGASVAAPYQALVANTATNLGAINSTVLAHPFPFLNQVASNQVGFAPTFGAGLATSLQNFPANVPANIQLAIQGASTFNPGALLQGFVTQQQGYAFTIGSSLQLAGQDINTGLPTLSAGFQAAFQNLFAGNPIGAYSAIDQALQTAFLPGFNVTEIGSADLFNVVPIGPLGDLAPIFTIPGQMAQNFTNLLPAGSIPAQIAQNATNLVESITNFGTTLTLGPPTLLSFGLPLQLVLDGIGGPANALSALNSTGVAFAGALQAGNASAAAAAILDAPALIANGYLNGSTVITLPPSTLSLFGSSIASTVSLPLGGALTPLSFPTIVGSLDGFTLTLPVTGGTPIGGLIPGLLSFGSELAAAITPTT